MKYFLKIFMIVLSVSCIIKSQFIVVRKLADGTFGPLTSQDISNQQIADVLLKYSWPSCLTQNLTEREKMELLRPSSPEEGNLEEEFIRSKIQAISSDLDIVFVSNTLYELFLLNFMDIEDLTFNIDHWVFRLLDYNANDLKDLKQLNNFNGDLIEFLKNEINLLYTKGNYYFFKINKGGIIRSLEQQKNFMQFLFENFSKNFFLKREEIFKFIYEQSQIIINKIIWRGEDAIKGKKFLEIFKKLKEDSNSSISKSIELDYMAYKKNMALLYRGTSFINRESIFGRSIKLLGTTMHEDGLYSVSFGNSLFAGYLRDSGACVYNYLEDNKELMRLQDKHIGYALFINKLLYMKNNISNLFFISGFSLETGLYGAGEWFHSRTKPASLSKRGKRVDIVGLAQYLIDPLGFFIVHQDPYKQAKLFSEYMARNMAILEEGKLNSQIKEEKEAFKELLEDQELLKKEYTIVEFLNRKIRIQKQKKLDLATAFKNKSKDLPKLQESQQIQKREETQESFNLFEWLHRMFMKD